ncbi:MAG: hypothetical protein ACRCZ6_17675 [Kluyvera sp.]|jgi:chromosome segregation ATPase|uniref:hypothetical protein n=1 Tax=Kluyvera sp. TaxID=1538228 RepID=UPI003F30781F
MTNPDEYQAFIQQLMRDSTLLDKQYKAFSELKNTIEELKVAAPHDADAARSLQRINALHSDSNFQALCDEAEKNLRSISRQIDSLDKQLSQAETTRQIPTTVHDVEPSLPAAGDGRKRRQRHFV